MSDTRSPIAALAKKWRETDAVVWKFAAEELEAAIAAQVEVWETDGLATVARCIQDLKGPKP